MSERLPIPYSASVESVPSDSRRLADLAALLEVSRQLSASVELDKLLGTIGSSCLKVLDCERSSIFLYDKINDELYSRVATGIGAGPSREIRFPADRGIAGEVLRTGKIVNVPDAYADRRFNAEVDRQTGFHTRNLLTCPLLGLDGGTVGVLQVLNKRGGSFNRWDEELIGSFAAQAGVALQRQLLLEERSENQRLQAELETARSIQQQLLPAHAPSLPGFDLAGWNQPADRTGGDFFDFVQLEDGQLALTLADVTGHGIGPALLAAECRALLRACLSMTPNLDEVLTRVNNLLAADIPDDRFVTAFVGMIRPKESICEYLSAGQGPVIHFQAATQRMVELPTSGLPLGVMAGATFTKHDPILLAQGDMLVLVTDGFVEWPNASGNRYGNERLFELVRREQNVPAAELIQAMYQGVRDFGGGIGQQDDLTAIVLRKL